MSRKKVLQWIEQFDDGDLECGMRVLQNIRYYSAPQIRGMLQTLVNLSYQRLRGIPRNKVYFVPVGRQGSGANILARALGGTARVSSSQVIHMLELHQLNANEVDGIVFLDDFSGTGDSLLDWWSNVEMMVRPKNARWVVAVLVLNYSVEEKLKDFTSEIVGVEHLSEEHNVLSPLSDSFTDPQKDALVDYCGRTNADEGFERGYGDCGLLMAFRHGCPDNSLPILWVQSSTWRPLFLRTAM